MKKIYLFAHTCLFLFMMFFVTSCGGQSNPKTAEVTNLEIAINLNWEPQIAEYVVDIFEDRKGNLWFGTMAKGVARYDGKTLTYFTTEDGLCGNTVSSIVEDKEGNLWFGSHTGLCKYDGESFTTLWETSGSHNKGKGWVSMQSDRDGNIWASSNEGVFRYDGSSFHRFKFPAVDVEILSYSITAGRAGLDLHDKNGNLWFGTDGYGAFKYDGTSFTHFTNKDGLCSNNITSIIEDKNGNIWFTCMQSYQPEMTGDGGVCMYNGNTIVQFPAVEGLNKNDIYTIYEDKTGNIWIGASGHGAYRYDGENFTLFSETDRMDLTDRFGLQDALEDKNGTLWFGFSGGLFRFNGESIINVTQVGPWP